MDTIPVKGLHYEVSYNDTNARYYYRCIARNRVIGFAERDLDSPDHMLLRLQHPISDMPYRTVRISTIEHSNQSAWHENNIVLLRFLDWGHLAA